MGISKRPPKVHRRSADSKKNRQQEPSLSGARDESAESRQELTRWAGRWLEARRAGRLDVPQDMHDRAAWDTYWDNQLIVGTIQQSFSDWMSSSERLPALLATRGARTILCAGNGLSTEPISLALMGFEVTALDISEVPGQAFANALQNPGHAFRQIPGCDLRDGILRFTGTGPIDPRHCPDIHRSDDYPPRRGGSLQFRTGDLTDPTICPGPYDVVIQRRTLQLFPKDEQFMALERLVGRLGTPGTLVTHRHVGSLQASASAPPIADWLISLGFVLQGASDAEQRRTARRLACVHITSG
jgi:hypothetical protein